VWAAVLVISTALINVVGEKEIRRTCGDGVWGCTRLEGGLAAWCVENGAGWSMRTAVRIDPVMYLSTRLTEDHERRHLADLQLRMRQFQAAAGSTMFPSAGQCRSAADEMRERFPAVLQSLIDHSNEQLR
jgi:hypothetical protein